MTRRPLISVLLTVFIVSSSPPCAPLGAEEGIELREGKYLLAPSDEIEISVDGEDDLSGVYKINSEGEIAFPLLGKVLMGALTTAQAEKRIADSLERDYFKTAVNVSVQVKKFHKRKVVISGEVNAPGSYDFEDDKDMTLAELITLAGGLSDKAGANDSTIVRSRGDGSNTTVKVRAGDILDAKERDIVLKPGDRVNIPSANVIIMGEVTKPGTYGFGDINKMTLLGAIALAGGFTKIAAINGVKVIRIDEAGNKRTLLVNVNNIYNGKEKDITLEPNDIVVVPESWF